MNNIQRMNEIIAVTAMIYENSKNTPAMQKLMRTSIKCHTLAWDMPTHGIFDIDVMMEKVMVLVGWYK